MRNARPAFKWLFSKPNKPASLAMPRISLENTKGADLSTRIGQVGDGQALGKLKDIQASLGTKGTGGFLRIIHTTKGNRDLQFETRSNKWWGPAYTPSKQRNEKNQEALVQLFTKAGKNLSENARGELASALSAFFQENSHGIKDLSSLILKFDQISQSDQLGSLIQPSPAGGDQLQNGIRESGNQMLGENIPQKNGEGLSPTAEEKPLDESHSSIRSNIEAEPRLDGSLISENPLSSEWEVHQDAFPKPNSLDQSHSPEDESHVSQENRFVFEEAPENGPGFRPPSNGLLDGSRYSFQSNSGDAFFLNPDGEQEYSSEDRNSFRSMRESIASDHHISSEFQEMDAPVGFDPESARSNAASALDSIKVFLNSSIPEDIQKFAKEVSDFQGNRAVQFEALRSRIGEMQASLGKPLSSVPDYLRSLQGLNADIQKFSESGGVEDKKSALEAFNEQLEGQIDSLRPFLPDGQFLEDLHGVFPELKELEGFRGTLEKISGELEKRYPVEAQLPDGESIKGIYTAASQSLDRRKDQLSDQAFRPELRGYETQIQDIRNFKGYESAPYDDSALGTDRKKLEGAARDLGEIKNKIQEKEKGLQVLLAKILSDQKKYAQQLGGDFNAGREFLNPQTREGLSASFEKLVNKTREEISQTQRDAIKIQELIVSCQETLPILEEECRLGNDDRAKAKLEEQAENQKTSAEATIAKQQQEAQKAAEARTGDLQASLDDGIAAAETRIAREGQKEFQKLASQFPLQSGWDIMVDFVVRAKKEVESAKVPDDLVRELEQELKIALSDQISEGGPVDAGSQEKWNAAISGKVKEWKNQPLYPVGQKQKLQALIAGQWGGEIKFQAESEIREINAKKHDLENHVAEKERDFSINQGNLGVEVRELTKKANELETTLEELASLPDRDIQNIENTEKQLDDIKTTLQGKIQELAVDFNPLDTAEGQEIAELDRKIEFIKMGMNEV